jgi:hypothetical protein
MVQVLSRDTGFGQGVEQCGLTHVGQAHDAAFQTHTKISLKIKTPVANSRTT